MAASRTSTGSRRNGSRRRRLSVDSEIRSAKVNGEEKIYEIAQPLPAGMFDFSIRRSTILERNGKKIVELVYNGTPPSQACDIVGVSSATYHLWMSKGRAVEDGTIDQDEINGLAVQYEEYYKFFKAIKRAEALYFQGHHNKLHFSKTNLDWYKNLTVLARRDYSNWGNRPSFRDSLEGQYNPDESFL